MTASDPLDLAVRDHMTQVLTVVLPTTSISAASRLTHDRHVGAVPVVDDSGRLQGVVSLSDLAGAKRSERIGTTHRHVMHRGKLLIETAVPGAVAEGGVVEELMTRDVVTISPSSTLRDAVKSMVAKDLHRVLVVDGDLLVGLLSTMDVLRALVDVRPPQDSSGF